MPSLAIIKAFTAIAVFGLLSACAGSTGNSDDTLGRALVAPGKYTLYSCQELATQAKLSADRARELQGLMAKADADGSGSFVNAIAYRPEYVEKRGELNELRNAAVAKNCKNILEFEGRASDNALR